MATCDVCGREENMPYRCRHCGGTYCSDHRLPENHNCAGLQDWGDPSGVFDSGFDDSVNQQGRARSVASRVTSTGGPLSYFRGNMTYLFLGLMLLTFVAQYGIAPIFGIQPGSRAWVNLFVLSGDNPLYVWTWVTSIFAHGSFGHIFGNGIALFFFGPIVERHVGSRAYTALFFASGILAGLGQVGLSLMLGDPIAGVLGASGAVMAILAVLTVLNPGMRVLLYFFIPVPIWVITFGYAGLSLVGTFSTVDIGGNIAHIAHLTGLVIGLAYGEYIRRQGVSGPNDLQLGGGAGGPGRGRGPF